MLDSVQCALRPDRNFRFAPIRLPRRNRDPQDVDFLRSHSLAPAAMSSLCIPDTATSTLGANSVVNAANDISCAPPLVSSLVASSTRPAWTAADFERVASPPPQPTLGSLPVTVTATSCREPWSGCCNHAAARTTRRGRRPPWSSTCSTTCAPQQSAFSAAMSHTCRSTASTTRCSPVIVARVRSTMP